MSQFSQPSSFSPLSMPLVKFSFATVANNTSGPIPWTHLSANENLFATFEACVTAARSGVVESNYRFRVLRDPEVMEDVNLTILGHEARRARTQAEAINIANKSPAVLVIVKCPRIAMRYPTNGSQIRRFQVCFSTDEHYYKAMEILSRAEVPTNEAGAVPEPTSTTFIPGQPNLPASGQLPRPSTASAVPSWPSGTLSGSIFPSGFEGIQCGPHATNSTSFQPKTWNPYATHPGEGSVSYGSTGHAAASISCFSGTVEEKSFANPTASRSTAQLQFPASATNHFDHRPSTAPVALSQAIDDGLPPRRELPFNLGPMKQPFAKSLTNASSIEPGSRIADTFPHNDNGASRNTEATDAVERFSVGPKRRRTSQGSKQTVTKREKKALAPSTSEEARKCNEQEDNAISNNTKLSVEHKIFTNEATIDTQALLARAEAKQKKPSTRSSLQDSAASKENLKTVPKQTKPILSLRCKQCKSRSRKCVTSDDDASCQACIKHNIQCSFEFPNAPTYRAKNGEAPRIQVQDSQPRADEPKLVQEIGDAVPRTIPEKVAESDRVEQSPRFNQGIASPHRRSGSQDTESTESVTDLDKAVNRTSGNADTFVVAANDANPAKELTETEIPSTDTAEANRVVNSSLQALLRDPNFARTPTQMTETGKSFDDLPENERRDAIRAYLISVLEDDNFLKLLNTMNGVWERMFFKL